MKTSNKLLIAFAAALIIAPIMSMVIVSKAYYTDQKNFNATTEGNVKQLDKTTDGYFKKNLQAFDKIIVPDGANMYMQLLIINSDKYGVKIPEAFKDAISFTVSPNNELSIRFDDKLDRSGNNGYGIIIMIYTPVVDEIDISNVGNFTLNAQLDSLHLKAKNTENINLGTPITYHSSIGATDNNSYVNNLLLDLNRSGLQCHNTSFNNLTVHASNKSEILLKGDKEQNHKSKINTLKLNTTGSVDFKVENVEVAHSIANVSDSTNLIAPTYMLRQMFKH